MPIILLTQERGDPVLINSDWIVHAIRICNSGQTARSLTRGNRNDNMGKMHR
jgi:hypothetical protein